MYSGLTRIFLIRVKPNLFIFYPGEGYFGKNRLKFNFS